MNESHSQAIRSRPAGAPVPPRPVQSAGVSATAQPQEQQTPPFRFYDNRQKYLAFVSTCSEKAAVARRASQELARLRPRPPALRVFDAGMGDATVLSRIMRDAHRLHPTVPLLAVAKEISLEDVRIGLEKMPDRFFEHPATVLAVTNLNYVDACRLMPGEPHAAAALNWQEVRLRGNSTHEYAEQIEELGEMLAHGWRTRSSPRTGNPVYVRPSVLVIYRESHKFLLEGVIPRPGGALRYDFVLASQPWRARTSAHFKAARVLAPLARGLAPGGRLLVVQSCGGDPAQQIIERLWPAEQPFLVDRRQLLGALRSELGRDARDYCFVPLTDAKSVFRYEMHTLPAEMQDRIGTSTLFAAWNAAIYVNQIEDERLESVMHDGAYLSATQTVLQKHSGLWFNDETFVVTRRKP